MNAAKIVFSLVALFFLFQALSIWSWNQYVKCLQPKGIVKVSDYFDRFGEPRSIVVIQLNGSNYYRIVGKFPNCPSGALALPSSYPAYLFDESGHYVSWCTDPGDIGYLWPKGWDGMGSLVELKSFEKEFGINPISK